MGANAVAELDIVIDRLKLGYTPERLASEGIKFLTKDGLSVTLEKGAHLLTMPPRRFRELSDTQIDQVIQFIKQEQVRLSQ